MLDIYYRTFSRLCQSIGLEQLHYSKIKSNIPVQSFNCTGIFFFFLFSHQLAVPHGDVCILEDTGEPRLQLVFCYAFFQNDLKEAAASGAAHHFAIQQVVHRVEDLVDQSVGGAGVDLSA